MSSDKINGKNNKARIEFVSRRLVNTVQKVKPIDNREEIPSLTNISTSVPNSFPSISSRTITTAKSIQQITNDINDKSKNTNLSSTNINKSLLSSTENINNLKEIKDSDHGCKNWFNRLSSKQKILFIVIIASLIILVVAAAVVPPVYLSVTRQTHSESSSSNISASICSTTTCIGKETPYRTSTITVLYPFDGNTNDQTGYATGTSFGSSTPTFSTAGYVSQCIILNPNLQQYIQIPNVNLAKQSFTLQAWLYPYNNTGNDFAIFGQCDSSSVCLSLSIRNGRIILSFDSMNSNSNTLIGTSIITLTWTHITVVYDAILYQQQIYVNGRIDAVSRGIVNSYQGTSSSSTTTLGKSSSVNYTNVYFHGRMDQFTISAGTARSACQIYNDASLIVYYPFDTTGTYNDYSFNLCNGVATGVTAVSVGRVNQAISFTSNTSYFQSQCFPRLRNNDQSFSFSLWINPTSTTNGGSLVHLSSTSVGNGSCYDPLVFTTTGNIVSQWMVSSTVYNIQGSVISTNTWTHIAAVYNTGNGVRLFINGQLSISSSNTGSINLVDTNVPLYLTLGNVGTSGSPASISCQSGSTPISSGPFSGTIDEFRIYNRELDNQEICVLANP